MEKEKVFEKFVPFNKFMTDNGYSKNELHVAKTTKGCQMLCVSGEVIAAIKNDLKRDTVKGTIESIVATVMSAKGATFAIPVKGTTDINGNPALPCLMASGGIWETEKVFSQAA